MDLIILFISCRLCSFVRLPIKGVLFTLILIVTLRREGLHQQKPRVFNSNFLALWHVNNDARLNHLLNSHFTTFLFRLKNKPRHIDLQTFIIQIACNFNLDRYVTILHILLVGGVHGVLDGQENAINDVVGDIPIHDVPLFFLNVRYRTTRRFQFN